MTVSLVIGLAVLVAALWYWFPIRRWYRRADARRLDTARAMSGDAEILEPDYDSTLAISIAAPPAVVWDTLLRFGWPREGRRSYEWLGRVLGYLEPYAAGDRLDPAGAPASLPVGRRSQIPVRSIVTASVLVLGRESGAHHWAWQFEISTLDERRTRLIFRDRARVPATIPARLLLGVAQAFSFVLTRKMLLDIKTSAEAISASDRAGRAA